MTEREKMLAGEVYDPGDAELTRMSRDAQARQRAYNATIRDEPGRDALARALFGTCDGAVVRAPVYVDYGAHVHLEPGVFLNFGCVFLDVCEIRIGRGTQVGPNVQFLAADHPRDPAARARGEEWGRPIRIGANCWIGGGAIFCPGVTVGDDAIVGAGAVVTRDVAPGTTVAGNPARPLRA